MAFALPMSGGPALAAPTVSGYGLSTTPAVLPGVPTPAFGGFGGFGGFSGFGAAPVADYSSAFVGQSFGAPVAAPFAGDFSGLYAGAPVAAAAPFAGDFSGLYAGAPFAAPVATAAPMIPDVSGLYSGYGAAPLAYDAGFVGAPYAAPTAFGGFAPTMTGAIAAPVAPARKVWQNGLRRSLVTGHPTRF